MKLAITRTNAPMPEEAKVHVSKTTAWRRSNPEKYAAQKERYRERQNKADAEYYARNRERIIARQMEYSKKYPAQIREKQKNWRLKNLDSVRSYLSNWREKNQELCQSYHQIRRGRILGNGGKPSVGISKKLRSLQKGKCACCKTELKKTKEHLDHIVPLARGGTSNDENLQLLCAKCNLEKKARCPIEFMQSKGYLL
jgi:5-methylcytosine-specific restriction endonuclease McrA